jgi:hypothetical protein
MNGRQRRPKIRHIVNEVPQYNVDRVVALARTWHVDYLEVTDKDIPNPFDNVLDEPYMHAVLSAISSGKVFRYAPPTSGGSAPQSQWDATQRISISPEPTKLVAHIPKYNSTLTVNWTLGS